MINLVFKILTCKVHTSLHHKYHALKAGKEVFSVVIKSKKKYFFAESQEQAEAKYVGHKVFSI